MRGALVRSALFLFVGPGIALVLLPAVVLSWSGGPRDGGAFRYVGLLTLAIGGAVLLWCFAGFAVDGRGTPAPYDPPRQLVTGRLYARVRNPMYAAVTTMLVGEAVLFWSGPLLGLAGIMWLAFHAIVIAYEEPTLRARFGPSYDAYRASVPRWIPRRLVRQY